MTLDMKRQLVDLQRTTISIVKQCEWLSLNRSSLYYTPLQESAYNLRPYPIQVSLFTCRVGDRAA